MGFESHSVGGWIRDFIRSGLPGISAKGMMVSWVPARRDFSASSVEKLAAAAINDDYRRRLLVVADAYRGHTAAEIARRRGIAHWGVSTTVRAFEADGPEGLSTGKATETPALRSDYSAASLREIASAVTDDDQCVRKLEALARLYDGMSMMEAGRDTLTLSGMVAFVDRFLRFGHEIAHSYKPHIMTPKAPPPRKAPEVVPPIAMRKDLNAMRMDRVRGAYDVAAASRIDIVIDAYNELPVDEIARRWDWTVANVNRWLKVFNENGLEALDAFRKKKRKLREGTRSKVAPRAHSVIRRIDLSGDWNARRIRDIAARTVDEAYRSDLLVVANLYEASGDTQRAARVSEVSEAEVERLAASFDLYGETFGQGMRRLRTLPPTDDLNELKLACEAPEPLATYASVICAIYGGKRIGNIRTTFSLDDGELELIVEAYALKRVQGLADDPLGVGRPMTWVAPTEPLARHAARERLPNPQPPHKAEQIQPTAKSVAPVKREYPGPHLTQDQKAAEKTATKSAVIAMFEGKNSRRLDAVREFHRNRNLQAVAKQFNVSPGTLENWLVAYVKTGMAERDRAAVR
ncbi:hypothetical protein D3C71_152310 [compost metagenome]